MNDIVNEASFDRYTIAAERGISPCDICEIKDDCKHICSAWEHWFGDKWRNIQKRFGKD